MTTLSINNPVLPEGPWQSLLSHAFHLLDDMQLHSGVANPLWTLGGGTVLMLRYAHRRSKDIDIFVPDPQYLGFVTPRLSEAAAAVSADYVEAANFVKLIRKEGEIDFVASPNLTPNPYETWDLLGRPVRVETATEIVAKKLWHRGDMATARDLFDLALVIDTEPDQLRTAAPFLTKHSGVFLDQLDKRHALIRAQFEAIDTLTFKPSFEHAFAVASQFLRTL
jgi:predicted nucleotidyltransferase component of viral defense system